MLPIGLAFAVAFLLVGLADSLAPVAFILIIPLDPAPCLGGAVNGFSKLTEASAMIPTWANS